MTTAIDNEKNIEYLNSFLRGELAAVETYQHALRVASMTSHRDVLERCARSHQLRVELLAREIERRDGVPANDSGLWGLFAKTVEGAASGFGENAALSALEEGENHGFNSYEREFPKLDPAAQQLLESRILPEQSRTHDALVELHKKVKGQASDS